MKISVVMPVYNEVNTIKEIIQRVKDTNVVDEIIVVDDCSTDGTREILQKEVDGIRIFYHEKNQGKGSALKTGFKEVTGDVVIIQDADLEYDPQEYRVLTEPIKNGVADVVYGSRLSSGRPQRAYMFWHKLGNQMLTLLINILYNTTLTDIETGYKVFRAEVIKNLKLRSLDFAIEVEMTAKILKNRELRVYEMPISYYGRTYKEGKKISWRDGFAALWAVIKYRFVK